GAVLAAARSLADAIGATVTLLGVAERPDDTEPLRAALERRREAQSCARAEVKIRNGDPARQLAVEQQQTFYELLVLAAADHAAAPRGALPARPSRLIMGLLQRPLTPVLVVNGALRAP